MSNQRTIIGNGGNRPEVHTSSITLPQQIGEDRSFGQYPGLGGGGGGGGNSFSNFGGGLPTPFEGGGGFFGGPSSGNAGGGFFGGGNAGGASGGGGGNFLSNLLGGGGGTGGASSNPLSGLNLKQISGFVERMGGIDGIIGTMGKVQKFMTSFQQMAPMVKTLLGSIGKGKVNSSDDLIEVLRPKRKRRKKSGPGSRRKGGSKSGTAKRNRR